MQGKEVTMQGRGSGGGGRRGGWGWEMEARGSACYQALPRQKQMQMLPNTPYYAALRVEWSEKRPSKWRMMYGKNKSVNRLPLLHPPRHLLRPPAVLLTARRRP